jgi:hypothetical protein
MSVVKSMNASCTDSAIGAPNVTPSTPPSSSTPAVAPPVVATTAPVQAEPSLDPEIAKIADQLARELLECLTCSTSWLVQAGRILGDYQRRTTHGQMSAIHRHGRLPWGQRYCQVLAVLARNPALDDPEVLRHLPSSVAALEIVGSYLDKKLIEDCVRRGLLHRGLTRKSALEVCRKLRTEALLKNPTTPLP